MKSFEVAKVGDPKLFFTDGIVDRQNEIKNPLTIIKAFRYIRSKKVLISYVDRITLKKKSFGITYEGEELKEYLSKFRVK